MRKAIIVTEAGGFVRISDQLADADDVLLGVQSTTGESMAITLTQVDVQRVIAALARTKSARQSRQKPERPNGETESAR